MKFILEKCHQYYFILVIGLSFILIPSIVWAAITGSPHDFSQSSSAHTADGEICKACHVPHNAATTEVPLWRSALTTRTYNLYSSSTLDATVGQPTATTKACLSCHDGTMGVQVGGCSACHSMHRQINFAFHHPVSFAYDSALAQTDGELHDPVTTTVTSLGGKTIQQGMLFQNRLECASCHDVHATKGDSSTTPKLLLVNNTNSNLCLTCHSK